MRKVRAFILIECLVAMLILGIASLLLVQGYTQLMRLTNKNNTRYMSIAQQMSDVESKNSANAKIVGTAATSDTYSSGEGHDIVLKRAEENPSGGYTLSSGAKERTYKTNVTVYATYSYERGNVKDNNERDTGKGTDTRYIYFHR